MSHKVLLLGPARHAVSGVSTHLNQLFASGLRQQFELLHFMVGSEGRAGGRLAALMRHVTAPWSFAWRLMIDRPSIVHINTSLNAKAYWRDLAFLLIAKLLRRKVVYQVHGGALPQRFFEGNRLLTRFLALTLRVPDVIVLLARIEMNAYRAFTQPGRLVLIPNAVDIPSCSPDPKRATARPRFIYLGRLVRAKGLFELLGAAVILNCEGHEFELVLAGDGPDAEALREYSRRHGIADRVIFPGAVDGAAKYDLLRTSDALVLPSYAEGLPYALLEGMAAGLAVVATDVGAIPDVVEAGASGMLVAPKDIGKLAAALVTLLRDPGRRERMGAEARERVTQAFTVDRMARDFACLYGDIAASRGLSSALSPEN